MNATAEVVESSVHVDPRKPLNLADAHFINNKYDYYAHLREHLPVSKGRISVVKLNMLSRYEDCMALVKDPRFGRNRANITGGSRMPFPVPKSVALIALSMIVEDDPEHRRLRNLVQKAFSPKSLAGMEARVEAITHELMDQAHAQEGSRCRFQVAPIQRQRHTEIGREPGDSLEVDRHAVDDHEPDTVLRESAQRLMVEKPVGHRPKEWLRDIEQPVVTNPEYVNEDVRRARAQEVSRP